MALASTCFKFNSAEDKSAMLNIYLSLFIKHTSPWDIRFLYTCMHASFLHVFICFWSSGASFGGASVYGEASGTIWLDDLVCTGSERSITQCQFNGWGVHDCGHHEDVSISCSSGQFFGSLRTQINTMPLESCKFLVYRKTYFIIPCCKLFKAGSQV